jgi:putative SOS response-associated peptidase YedK
MCGRYASARKRIELLEEFGVQRDAVAEPLQPDYNVAPTKPVYTVLDRAPAAQDDPGDVPPGAGSVERELRVMRWGLVPFWAKDVKIGSRMINARAETLAEKPAFRRAFAKRRCLLPADGYYEWQQQDGAKHPVYITRADGRPLALAGLYELWRDPALARPDPDSWLWTTTIITTSAPDELGMIHDRMPMIIDEPRWADWLDPETSDVSDLRALLVPAAVSGLQTYPVSTQVNSVRNNGPWLIEPLEGLAASLAHRPVPGGDLGTPRMVAADAAATRTQHRLSGARSAADNGTQALF